MKNKNENKKCIFLHIGMPKTGSSSLQLFLRENKEILEKKGYTYPVMPFCYPGISDMRNGHFLFGEVYHAEGEVNREKTGELRDDAFRIVREELERGFQVILSDEGIWNSVNPSEDEILSPLVQFCEKNKCGLRVIVYLRRQDSFLESYWKQRIRRRGATWKWERVRKNPPSYLVMDYYRHLRGIADIVGKENMEVRRYGAEYFEGGGHTIFSDFLGAVGLTLTEEYQQLPKQVNVSLHNNYAEIKRILNFWLPEDEGERESQDQWVKRLAVECSEMQKKQYNSSLFSEEERHAFLNGYRESNNQIAREFLGQEELFTEETDDLPKWKVSNPQQYEDTVFFLGKALIEQHREVELLKKKMQAFDKPRISERISRRLKRSFRISDNS